jgi:hypothetical protein
MDRVAQDEGQLTANSRLELEHGQRTAEEHRQQNGTAQAIFSDRQQLSSLPGDSINSGLPAGLDVRAAPPVVVIDPVPFQGDEQGIDMIEAMANVPADTAREARWPGPVLLIGHPFEQL